MRLEPCGRKSLVALLRIRWLGNKCFFPHTCMGSRCTCRPPLEAELAWLSLLITVILALLFSKVVPPVAGGCIQPWFLSTWPGQQRKSLFSIPPQMMLFFVDLRYSLHCVESPV